MWKTPTLVTFLKELKPSITVEGDTCICRNCHDDLARGHKNPSGYHPRWWKRQAPNVACKVPGCRESCMCRTATMGGKDLLHKLFDYVPKNSGQTYLCCTHYRVLHRTLNPSQYQLRCAACSSAIRGIVIESVKRTNYFKST